MRFVLLVLAFAPTCWVLWRYQQNRDRYDNRLKDTPERRRMLIHARIHDQGTMLRGEELS